MDSVFARPLTDWAYYLLLFARTVSVCSIAPIFGGRNVPAMARIGISASLAFIFSLALPEPGIDTRNLFLILLPSEVLVGFSIGFISLLIFNAVQMAGNLIDIPMGFSMANVFDPNTETNLPIMGDFYYVLTMLLFVVTNAHHLLISAILDSYNYFAVGQIAKLGILSGFTDIFARMFVIGVRISIPVVGVMLMSDAALALLARTVPSLNAFIMGAPIKIGFGSIAMFLGLGAFISFAVSLLHSSKTGMAGEILIFLRLLGGDAP